jgi:hypothetical protein
MYQDFQGEALSLSSISNKNQFTKSKESYLIIHTNVKFSVGSQLHHSKDNHKFSSHIQLRLSGRTLSIFVSSWRFFHDVFSVQNFVYGLILI